MKYSKGSRGGFDYIVTAQDRLNQAEDGGNTTSDEDLSG